MQIKDEQNQEKTLSQKARAKRAELLEPEVVPTYDPKESFDEDKYTYDAYNEVAQRAYYKAEKRGFTPGNELDDWLEAEKECGTRH